ncbi:ABC transporter permease [Phyllobacterium endophyticum]|jgi:ribose transport system permease protein|uniref:ABC transporter permease n=1 Tax=Phyllobacterium endophyticum TaxID=1149773 RepID=A0A2P7AKM8_9HYPH|nr:ABC transporter permease [Phyllobacterium endophyticum]MBB3233368.1 ribose transport system permease protein [Phyllobacterium endophyticum]PSH54762.1 ABC transporter permease [Phyllobacterium endophyticum]TYR43372.1 ABC transporter permease [Phyllobacterium endophyticum]
MKNSFDFRSMISNSWVQGAIPPALLAVLIIIVEIGSPGFLTGETLALLLSNTAVLFILATGVTFVILIGGIDLSIQAVASLASVILAQLLPSMGLLAFPVAIAAGLVFGILSGVVHVWLRVPSFVATLATGGVVAGMALWLANGRAITIEEGGRASTSWINATIVGTPVVVLIAIGVGLASYLGLRYSRFGRQSLAVGAGEPAAYAAGINVDRTKIVAFALSGTLAAIAGVVLAARLSSGSPSLANQLLLPAIAAVIVGGTAITGGLGGVGRTAVGALIISIVRIGMTFVGVNIFAENVVFGAVLIAAVAITIDRSKIAIIK